MTDAELKRIVGVTLRAIDNKDACKAYGIDLAGVNDLELHADVLAVMGQIWTRDASAAQAIKANRITFYEVADAVMPDRVADAGTTAGGVQTVRINPRHMRAIDQKERRRILAHEVAHIMLGHHLEAMTATPGKAKHAIDALHESAADAVAARWGF
jgi:hypothetical protein